MAKSVPLALAFLIGLLCGALFIAPTSNDPSERPPSAPDPILSSEPAETEFDSPTPAAATVAPEHRDSESSELLLSRAIEAIEVDLPGDLHGTITGTAVSTDGSPIIGAKVTAIALSTNGSPFDPSAEWESLEARVRSFVASRRFREATTIESESDSTGSFRLDRIGSTEYQVRIERPGFDFKDEPRKAHAGEALEFVAEPTAVAFLHVRTAAGELSERARFRMQSDRSRARYLWDPAKPRLNVQAGSFEVSVQLGDLYSQSVEAEFRVGEETELEFLLQKRSSLSGRIILPANELPGSEIFLGLLPCSEYPDPAITDLSSAFGNSPRGGEYLFENLESGEYWLCIGRGSHRRSLGHRFEPVVIGKEDVRHDLVVADLERSRGVTVTVFDRQGNLVTDCNLAVQFEREEGKAYATVWGSVVKQRDGSIFTVISPSDLENFERRGGTLRVTAQCRDGRAGSAIVPGGPGGEVRIDLAGSTTVRVQVSGIPDGMTARVELEAVKLSTNFGYREVDSNGRAEFTRIPAGTCWLKVAGRSTNVSESQEFYAEMIEVHEALGDHTFEVQFPPLHSVEILAPEGCRGRFDLYQFEGRRYRAEVVDGVAIAPFVVAGEYTLTCTDREFPGRTRVVVPTTGPIEWATWPPNALYVKIDDPDGSLGRAGLRRGDFILRVGGESGRGEEHLLRFGALLRTQESFSVTVVRDGEELELELDSEVLADLNWRGSLHPDYYY